jgi:hypothetical protein
VLFSILPLSMSQPTDSLQPHDQNRGILYQEICDLFKAMTDLLDMMVEKELQGRQSRLKSFKKGNDIIDILVDEENCLNKDDVCLADIEQHCTHIVEVPCATNLTHDIEFMDKRDNMLDENDHVNKSTENIMKGNDMCSMILQGEKTSDVPNSATIHASVEHSLVTPFSSLSFSHDGCLHIPYDTEELCYDSSITSLPQLVNKLHILVSEPIKCAENIHIHPIGDTQDELNLLSSLNTLGFIEFDVLCDLNNLKEKLLLDSHVQWLTRNTCHVMGRYNCNGDYMVHQVYIFSKVQSSLVVQQYDQVESNSNTNPIMSSSSSSIVGYYLVYLQQGHSNRFQEGENDEIVQMFVAPGRMLP